MKIRANWLAAALLATSVSAGAWSQTANVCPPSNHLGSEGGTDNQTCHGSDVAFGWGNVASGGFSNAFGYGNTVNSSDGVALGVFNVVNSGSDNAIAIGAGVAPGLAAFVGSNASSAVAIGHTVFVGATDGVAIGRSAVVMGSGTGAIALGSDALADSADVVSVGHRAGTFNPVTGTFYDHTLNRRIINVAAASSDTDAVNLAQLEAVTAAFGGGAGIAGGVFTAPTFTIHGTSYNNVGAAFGAVDASITDLYDKVANAAGIPGPAGPQGPKGDPGAAGPAGPPGGGPREVVYDQDAGDTLTLNGANGTVVSNVAAGKAVTDAANVGQVQSGDAATLQSANRYADTQAQEALQSANTYADAGDAQTLARAEAYTDSKLAMGFVTQDAFDRFQQQVGERFHQVDVRMARIGAMGQAVGGMAGAIAAGDRTQNRISAAVGSYAGQNAMAVGYSHLLPGHGSVLIGGTAASGGETGGTVGVSFGW